MSLPADCRWEDPLRLGDETALLTARAWPNYLLADSDAAEPAPSFTLTGAEILRRFPAWGIRRATDKALLAFANGVTLHLDPEADSYSDDGWRFALRAAAESAEPNALCLLSASVAPEARGLGLSVALLERAKEVARARGFRLLVGPVRPSRKAEFPREPMEVYLERRNADGSYYDDWIRSHVRLGGEVMNVCSQSVIVRASKQRWAEWLGYEPSDGEILPGGLTPLRLDPVSGLGTYEEPNVWVRYRL